MNQIILERKRKRLAFFQDMLNQYGCISLAEELEKIKNSDIRLEAFYAALTRWLL